MNNQQYAGFFASQILSSDISSIQNNYTCRQAFGNAKVDKYETQFITGHIELCKADLTLNSLLFANQSLIINLESTNTKYSESLLNAHEALITEYTNKVNVLREKLIKIDNQIKNEFYSVIFPIN